MVIVKENKQIKRYWRDIKKLEAKCLKCEVCGKQLHSLTATHCNRCKPLPQGKEHWNWRGGRISTGTGYIKVYVGRVDGISRYKLEHHLVWEQAHKRKLPKGYLVHHLNGIKDDNRPENLAAIPRKKHSVWTLVVLSQKRIRELEQLHLSLT